ncbi:hypothetical protein CORC01_02554 [Colletotrichum orchidophilum]|uniref:Rhodopsin domain-containing protein n=1 Tax=Colletotrichum orchidophilum TaxID=1209926 RepID=A0A1G4BLJ2_9PEZI|nr:uncharacterized protein CORC01_02554 [Colletotrichum orchidophilum]OHF02274.1 hypothetical protein CORC01_02554 [Colletotrichum orchidophilum]
MPVNFQPDPPFYPLAENDHAALVVVASLIFLIYAIVGISLKLVIRLNITSLKSHDVALLVASGLLLSQTVCIIVACNHGLGRHQDTVESRDLETFHQLFYTSSLLAIATAASTKVSLCLLIHSIDNHGRLNLANKLLFGTIVAWGVSGIFAVAFQCSLPQPWRAITAEKCPSRERVFLYNGVMDIVTDVSCIPSLKGVIDSLLGSTSVAAIRAPYHLTSSGKDGSRLQPTSLLIGSGSNTRPGSHLASGAGDSRTARAGSICCGIHGSAEKEDVGYSESVRRLTRGGEFGMSPDERRRSSSQEGSLKSGEAELR